DRVKDGRWKEWVEMMEKRQGTPIDDLPVMCVTVTDALRFARWMDGDLPSTSQWDKASGLYELEGEPRDGEGPFEGPWAKNNKNQIAVQRGMEGPMPVGQASKDVAKPYKCRDMAGNGREWTHSLTDVLNHARVTLESQLVEDERVILRGRGYDVPEPLY